VKENHIFLLLLSSYLRKKQMVVLIRNTVTDQMIGRLIPVTTFKVLRTVKPSLYVVVVHTMPARKTE
jgi:hypothetical protein